MRRTPFATAALGLLAVAAVTAGVLVPASPAAAAASFATPDDSFFGSNTVVIQGVKDAGSTVFVNGPDGSAYCDIDDPEVVEWACPPLEVANGSATFTGVETLGNGDTQPLTPITVRVLGAPAIDSAGAVTTGRFTGTAEPGALIRLQIDGDGGTVQQACPSALADGFWSCVVDGASAPSGRYSVRAGQAAPDRPADFSGYSPAISVTIDRDRPASPVVTAPAPGTRTTDGRLETRGTGEPSATVQVFASGTLLCETTVAAAGGWSCPIGLPAPGEWSIQVLQIDPAGNFSAPAAAVGVLAGPAGATPRPPTPEAPEPRPTAPTPSPSPSPEGEPTPAPTAPGDGSAPPSPQPRDPGAPAETGTNWGTPTGFGSALPTLAQVAERGGLLLGLLVALGYLLLIALPLRAFATIALPRLRSGGTRMLGRNRPAVVDPEPLLSPTVTAVAVFGVAAVLAALSGSVAWEVRYLRLTAAIGLGLLVLNAIGVAVSGRLAGRVGRAPVAVQLLPGILFTAAAAAVLTRFGDLRPALLIGVLVVASAAGTVRMRARVAVAGAQLAGVALLAVLGWAAHDLLTPSTGFWMSLWSETAAAIALGGLGSLLLLLLPIGQYPGRALYAVSRPLWAAAALVTAAVAGAIFAAGANFPLVLLTLVAAAVAAVLMAITSWVRWVEPTLR
ncbi:Ig-like domain-containing protein [Microcella daejeonensis]|uniref:Ig-like domain-containing protein n=1 Tax=Microcella daejeonensis TaxID=2994971 RepID=UPI0022710BC3|nr:Ig-like domain-containing protein [Microcella daejeonensis]WAB85160.1 Ig-like domain-containing protein [Microcella daejeonensis]